MRRLQIMMAGLVMGLLAAAGAQAQESTLLSQAVQSHWIQFSINDGRIAAESTRDGDSRVGVSGKNRRREQISVRNNGGKTSITYEQNGVKEQWNVNVTSGDNVLIRRSPVGKSDVTPVEFVQTPNEKITLSWGAPDHRETITAASLWHLFIIQPEKCREHLTPVLQMLRPDARWAETVAKVEERLLAGSADDSVAARARWANWVAQLGDDRFAKREAADRALRSADRTVAGYLRALDFRQLDAEQQFRVRRIIESFADQTSDDSPEQVAASLAGDPAVWLALLERPEAETRRIAVRQLATLLGEAVAIDPEADPASQQTQREQLKKRIEGK